MTSKEIMVNLMVEKICEYIDADEVHRICVHGKEFAEVKKGKWIGKPLAGRCTVRCSNCRNVFAENNGLWNYCPNCGTDMRGDNNETN